MSNDYNFEEMMAKLTSLVDSNYREYIGSRADRTAGRLLSLNDCRLEAFCRDSGDNPLAPVIDRACDQGVISNEEWSHLADAAIVVSGTTEDNERVYALAVATYTITERQVNLAEYRASLLERASEVRTIPYLIGNSIEDEAANLASQKGIRFLQHEKSW